MIGRRVIQVWADWHGLAAPTLMGHLTARPSRGKEIFSFEYERAWLEDGRRSLLDPNLALFRGPQYPPTKKTNFGVFLDSCPDRWGRVLMRRREAHLARSEGREERRLLESDYLLGVHDGHRMGALRFRVGDRFLDDNDELASPPWTSLRELEHASLELEREDADSDPNVGQWLRVLIAPGGSLGGARPKASVLDPQGHHWIAKFPSRRDDDDVGAWESVVHELARLANVSVPEVQVRRFASSQHTFLSRRFDRTASGDRLHFASAMTMLEREDGDDAEEGASYLELADFLMRFGARANLDLEELWRRIVFNVCVSNTDDHLRNHGFLLTEKGWILAPAYDMNPDPMGEGLRLNISESDNTQSLEVALDVASIFRVDARRAGQLVDEVSSVVRTWPKVADERGLPREALERKRRAFRLADRGGR